MVNNLAYRILVGGSCKIKTSARGGLSITNGPVYDLLLAQQMLIAKPLFVVNQVAQKDQVEQFLPEMTDSEITNFVLALGKDEFIISERCKTSVGMTIDCDGYAMNWNRTRNCKWEFGAKIYVKLGFSNFNNGTCLIVCIHPSKW